MRLWPIAVITASFMLGAMACGSGGSGGSSFPESDASGPASGSSSGSTSFGGDGGTGTTKPTSCTPKTCADLGATCGPQGDSCGGIIDGGCGTCTNGQTCGGGGTGTSTCGGQVCVPKSCAQQGIGCGAASDGCGNLLNCYPDDAGACPSGQTCGGGGAFQCGTGVIPDGGGAVNAAACVPTSCQVGQCGPTQNGCGASLDCGGCDGGVCGYPTSFFCGYPPSGGVDGGLCVPKTCGQQGIACGLAGDGCGNVINCWPTTGAGADGGSCLSGSVCGLYDAGQCGAPPSTATDGGSACVPSKTCSGLNCGYIDDGCGHILDCWPNGGSPDAGASCSGFNTCGGGGTGNVCGGSPAPTDGGSLCVPLTCAQQNISCGSAGDGCGHTLNCYQDGGASCGTNAKCEQQSGSGPVTCVPTTTICTPTSCAAQNIACGQAGDGCGNTLDCYADGGASCGGGASCITVDGGAVQCVPPTTICNPTTCTALNYNCGYAGDNCGNLLDCNATDAGCTSPETCGGGGPNQCGFGYTTGDGGSYVACTGTSVTSITGKAFAATDPSIFDTSGVVPDPLSGAYVWVSSSTTLPPIVPGITCTQCADPATALAVAITNPDGSFTLPNVPIVSGQTTVPIVVQVGRWARLVNVSINPCAANAIADYTLRLPRNSSEGNMPWFAFNTGSVDSLECVLLKMGIQSSMFSSPSAVISDMGPDGGAPVAGGTRVAIYTSPDTTGSGSNTKDVGGAIAPDGGTTSGATLYGSATNLDKFDAVLFPCVGSEITSNKTATDIRNVVDYANSGGRFFATHYSYVWAFDDYNDGPTGNKAPYGWGCTTTSFSGGGTESYNTCDTANETVGEWDPKQTIANSVTANIDTSTANGQNFGQWMVDVGAGTIASGALADGGVGASTAVTFGIDNARWDLNSVNSEGEQWAYYNGSVQQMTFNTPVNVASTSQCGRVVFSDFHVNNNSETGDLFPTECTDGQSSTVTGNLPPLTSQERALEYMIFNLTSCVSPTNPTNNCTKKTCSSYPPGTCGDQSDGCGSFITCATCTVAGQTCGGGGVANQCGGCTKRTCSYYGTNVCGTQSDGCGGTLTCATCTIAGQTCGGGGVADQCGACVPKTCAAYPTACGQQADGCGGLTLSCNPCTSPETCGGSGTPDVCGIPDASVCTPKTCSAYATGTCGQQSDGCGGLTKDCSSCTLPQTCGGGGVANQCGAPDSGACAPATCASFPGICGQQADGCGSLTSYCNPCPGTQTCGGGGVVGVCGSGSCVPTTCKAQNISCGPAGDGCGGALDCGSCATGQTCGGGGQSGVCGGCSPITCSTAGVGCGTNGDGCGGEITCSCPTGQTCGGGGVAGACGAPTSCVPATCASLNLACGYEANGCGALLDCGTCPNGGTCVSGACVGGAPGPQVSSHR